MAEQAAKKHAAVARLLGVESLEPALDALRAGLAAEGRSLGGRKEMGCKGKEGLQRLRRICEDRLAHPEALAGTEGGGIDGSGGEGGHGLARSSV